MHNQLLQFKPTTEISTASASHAESNIPHASDTQAEHNASADSDISGTHVNNEPPAEPAEPTETAISAVPTLRLVNQSIVDMQIKYSDAVGWLTIPNTLIDYPFVQANDNNHYLHTDLDQRWSQAGTIFMDYRNSNDFSDFNTIIFGHNMKNGSMFGSMQKFDNPGFFDSNKTGTIFLADMTYELEIIAFAVIKPDDTGIYNPYITTEADRIAFLDYVKSVARHYRYADITPDDRFITLSTCNYEFNDARMVIIARIVA